MKKIVIILFKLITQLTKIEILLISLGLIIGIALLFSIFYIFINQVFEKVPSYGGTLKEAFYSDVETLNPFLAESISEKTLVNLMYDSLIRPNGLGGYEFELAKNITEINNGLSYEVELKDAYWSNGSKITADDIITTIEILKIYVTNELNEMFRDVNVEKIDNYKVKFNLNTKDNLFLQKLSYLKIIFAKEWAKYKPSEWKVNEEKLIKITSGPYYFYKKYEIKGIKILSFKRNEYYHPKPYLDEIEIYLFPNLNQAYDALKIKMVNSLGGIKPFYIKSISRRSNAVIKIIIPRVIGLFFNKEKLKDENYKYLKNAIEREKLVEEVFEGYGEPAYSIFSPTIRNILKLSYQNQKPAFQKEINLNQLKFNDYTLIVPDNFFFTQIGSYLQKNFGFNIKIEPIERIINQIIPNKEYDVLLFGISYNLIPHLQIFFEKTSILNLTNYQDLELIKKIQEFQTKDLTASEKEKLLQEIESLIDDKQPFIPILNNYFVYIVPNDLKSVEQKMDYLIFNGPEERFVKIEEWYLFKKIKW